MVCDKCKGEGMIYHQGMPMPCGKCKCKGVIDDGNPVRVEQEPVEPNRDAGGGDSRKPKQRKKRSTRAKSSKGTE